MQDGDDLSTTPRKDGQSDAVAPWQTLGRHGAIAGIRKALEGVRASLYLHAMREVINRHRRSSEVISEACVWHSTCITTNR